MELRLGFKVRVSGMLLTPDFSRLTSEEKDGKLTTTNTVSGRIGGAYSALLNYATLYVQGSPWAQKWEKANYANSVIGW